MEYWKNPCFWHKLQNVKDNIFINPVFWSTLIAMFIAQLAKCFVEAFINKKWSIHPFFTNGGMPSSHSSSVAALANSIGMVYGYGSTTFIFALLFAFIVFNDAINVRLETGKQAQTNNQWSKLFQELLSPEAFREEHFKTLVGHTKLQVLWGIIIGIVVSTLITVWF